MPEPFPPNQTRRAYRTLVSQDRTLADQSPEEQMRRAVEFLKEEEAAAPARLEAYLKTLEAKAGE